VNDARRVDRQRVAIGVGHRGDPELLVDHKDKPLGGGQAEDLRVVELLVADVDQIDQAWDGRVDDHRVVAHGYERSSAGAAVGHDLNISHVGAGDGGRELALGRRDRVELELAAVGKGDGNGLRARGFETELGKYAGSEGLVPELAEVAGLFEADVLDAESPA